MRPITGAFFHSKLSFVGKMHLTVRDICLTAYDIRLMSCDMFAYANAVKIGERVARLRSSAYKI